MFAMRPWYASEPRQLGGARVASVIDPVAVSRAWALQALLDGSGERDSRPIGAGVGATARAVARPVSGAMDSPRSRPLAILSDVLDWSRSDPEGLLAAARYIAAKRPLEEDTNARRLMRLDDQRAQSQTVCAIITRRSCCTLGPRPWSRPSRCLNAHPDEIERVLLALWLHRPAYDRRLSRSRPRRSAD